MNASFLWLMLGFLFGFCFHRVRGDDGFVKFLVVLGGVLLTYGLSSLFVGRTPGFGGDTAAALGLIRVPVLYMPSATDLYFPLEDARYECGFIRNCLLYPIPSLWGHPAGAGATPTDAALSTTMSLASWRAHGQGRTQPRDNFDATNSMPARYQAYS